MSNDLAKQVWDDASALARAQIELAQTVDMAPRNAYLLWNGPTVVLGVFGTKARAEREMAQYLEHTPDADLWVETRVMLS